jgi:DNA-binding GntR family transcriptional regulator
MGKRAAAVSKLSATDLAYETLKREILDNTLAPGDAIAIDRYVRQLKVSRTPVREAILRLERERLIEIRPRMGTFVAPLDLRLIRELYGVRRLLEGEAARLAAGRIPAEALERLRMELRGLEGPRELFEKGQEVHLLCTQHCGNQTLRQMIASVQDHFVRFRRLSMDIPEKLLNSHREHSAILDALCQRDGEAAQQRMHEHFDHAAQYLLDSLLSRDTQGPRIMITLPQG